MTLHLGTGRRVLLAAAGLLAAGACAAGVRAATTPSTPTPTAHRFDAPAAIALIRAQVGYGQRPAGSPQLRRLAARLRVLLPGGRYEAIPGEPELRNVVGSLPGTEPAIVLGAHYDTLAAPKGFVGANNGASGTAIVVEVARALVAMKRSAGAPAIRFVLYDGEEPPQGLPEDDPDFYGTGLRGSRADAAAHAAHTRAMILLDYVGNRGLRLPREDTSDKALWARVRAAAHAVGAGAVFPPREEVAIEDDHTPYEHAGVPAVDLIDWSYPGHTLADGLDQISQTAVDDVGETITQLLTTWR